MAGHSKWLKVKHIKGPLDVKRGAMFSRLVKEIALVARLGGGAPLATSSPPAAIDATKAGNMSKDNIERAVKEDTGEFEGDHLEEINCEDHAPGGVAVIVETATDNKNRTAADIRGLSPRHYVSLATAGNISYIFHKKGEFAAPPAADVIEERPLEFTLDAGTGDFIGDENYFILTSPPDRFYAVDEALRAGGIAPEMQRLSFVPDLAVPITNEALVGQVLRFGGAPEDF